MSQNHVCFQSRIIPNRILDAGWLEREVQSESGPCPEDPGSESGFRQFVKSTVATHHSFRLHTPPSPIPPVQFLCSYTDTIPPGLLIQVRRKFSHVARHPVSLNSAEKYLPPILVFLTTAPSAEYSEKVWKIVEMVSVVQTILLAALLSLPNMSIITLTQP